MSTRLYLNQLALMTLVAISAPLAISTFVLAKPEPEGVPPAPLPVPSASGKPLPPEAGRDAPPPPSARPLPPRPGMSIPPAPSSMKVAPSAPDSRVYPEHRLVEKARHELAKAREEGYRVEYLARQVTSSKASELVPISQRILKHAESSYNAGRYFEAVERAKAAKDLYEAAETLYEGELGYVVGPRGPSDPSRSYFEAPYKAQELLTRAEAEMSYYRSTDSSISELIARAKTLVGSVTPVSNSSDFVYLAQNRAAEHVVKAAMHLMAAERGF